MNIYTVLQTEEFISWLDSLRDLRAKVRIAARLRQAEAGHLGDWKPIQGEIAELRIHFGPGYRIYFVRRGRTLVVLLNAGDKASQQRDISRAMQLASELGENI